MKFAKLIKKFKRENKMMINLYQNKKKESLLKRLIQGKNLEEEKLKIENENKKTIVEEKRKALNSYEKENQKFLMMSREFNNLIHPH